MGHGNALNAWGISFVVRIIGSNQLKWRAIVVGLLEERAIKGRVKSRRVRAF